MVPSAQTCYQLIEEMGMLDHIVSHSEQVCRVALCLTDRLDGRFSALDRHLVIASALLHDITKTRSFETGENHALTGEQLLKERGYPEVGRVVGRHVHIPAGDLLQVPDEAQIVNYADKRVLHDEVVSLERRMHYIVERYGRTAEHRQRIMSLWEQSRMLEKRLFTHIDFAPEVLRAHLGPWQRPAPLNGGR
ncbi:MAG: HD domain-containing protein [Deltaproteobacteria bacterium]|nr:HD domain-containing protein [Deltaproteobacteria bacterium]